MSDWLQIDFSTVARVFPIERKIKHNKHLGSWPIIEKFFENDRNSFLFCSNRKQKNWYENKKVGRRSRGYNRKESRSRIILHWENSWQHRMLRNPGRTSFARMRRVNASEKKTRTRDSWDGKNEKCVSKKPPGMSSASNQAVVYAFVSRDVVEFIYWPDVPKKNDQQQRDLKTHIQFTLEFSLRMSATIAEEFRGATFVIEI